MIASRRRFLIGAVTTVSLGGVPLREARANWRAKYPVMRYGVITTDTGDALSSVYKSFDQYLARALDVKTEMFFAAEYAAVIEALKSSRVQLAQLYAGSYAAAYDAIQGDIEPLAMNVDKKGGRGYYSYLIVRTDSPYHKLDDLRGKKLAMSDPNSTSGYIMPTYYLAKQGVKLTEFFGQTQFVGGHEPGLQALLNGTFDAMFTWRFPHGEDGPVIRMEKKGIVPKGAFREIWVTPEMAPNDPWTVRKSAPADFKADVQRALLDLPTAAPEAWNALYRGAMEKLVPITHDAFAEFVEMRRFNEKLRRAR
jgi:phosphonate transport system substrate-binding protein